MKAKVESRKIDGKDVQVLVLECVLPTSATLSSSRKSFLVASHQGPTAVEIGGESLTVGLNAYYANRDYVPTADELAAEAAKRAARRK